KWIEIDAKGIGMNIYNKAKFLLGDFLGNDLGRIYNELLKLKVVVKNAEITPEIIEQNIGISKDFNNFELRKAIETKNAAKAFQISKYFSENPKDKDRKSTRLNSSHVKISYAVFCLKKKKNHPSS